MPQRQFIALDTLYCRCGVQSANNNSFKVRTAVSRPALVFHDDCIIFSSATEAMLSKIHTNLPILSDLETFINTFRSIVHLRILR